MATGFAPYLLNDIKSVVGSADPKHKVDMHGFTKFLYQGAGAAPVQTNTLAGGKREVRFWYRQRNTKAQTAKQLAQRLGEKLPLLSPLAPCRCLQGKPHTAFAMR